MNLIHPNTNTHEERDSWTETEVARRWNCEWREVVRLIGDGDLRAHHIGNCYLICQKELERYEGGGEVKRDK